MSDHLKDWFKGSDHPVSMGVIIPPNIYNIPAGICFSLPVICSGGGEYTVIEDIKLSEAQFKKIGENLSELEKEM